MDKLPKESLTRMIDHTGSCHSIGQCRLVCKQWNELAEPLLFTKQIVLKNERTTVALLGHLYRNPANGKHIKSLEFGSRYIYSAVLSELLRLTLTPNMEYMTGIMRNPQFYVELLVMAGAEPERFNKLKALPYPLEYSSQYGNALLTFKDSLQYVTLVLDGYETIPSDIFKDFKNLRNLKLDGFISDILTLENMLHNCNSQEVAIHVTIDEPLVDKSIMEVWNSVNTKVVSSVKKLSIACESRSDVLEYLVFKYPNMDTLEMNADKPLSMARSNMERILRVIKKINSYKALFMVNQEVYLLDCITILITSGTHFTIKDADEGFLVEITSA